MRGNLWDDPRVSKLCDLTGCGEAQIVGGLYWLWSTADQHTEDGCMPGLTLRQIDRKTGITGFGAALCDEAVGWLKDDPQGAVISRFEEHNGSSAKRRCMDAQRKASSRGMSAFDADIDRTDPGQGEDGMRRVAELEKEKRREEINTSNLPVAPARPSDEPPPLALVEAKKESPPCPHLAVLGLWAEVLPALPRHAPAHWRGTRADHLRARWRETAEEKGWQSQAEGLAYMRKLFGYIGQSQFLTGRVPTRDPTKRLFVIELEWLVSPRNWAKVLEGKYHQEAA